MIKTIKWQFVIIFIVFLSLNTTSYAATGTPTIFSYQGRLTNAAGALQTGTFYFKFSIWDVATGGTAGTNRLWPSGGPAEVSATVTSGVFNVNIGDTDNGYPDSLDYNFNTNKDIYLQVEASSSSGSGFETLDPRQRISSAVFARLAAAVSGTGQSSFGTTTPSSGAIVTVAATTTSAIPLFIRGALGQVANLFRIENSISDLLFSIDYSGGIFSASTTAILGNVGVGTTTLTRKFNVFSADSVPQFRLNQSNSNYGEFQADSSGDIKISSTGGNIRGDNENLWICEGAGCGADDPADKGNVIVETKVIFNNNFKLGYTSATTTTMYNSTGTPILIFDQEQ
ncbi:MAG: hypothetical protein HYW79_00255 [Parcubacteria group bacterium]|nr:hypothetical protein [Parcubacteria group bacterium]